jgi:uncharacterized protein YbaA (DUF1428 family)
MHSFPGRRRADVIHAEMIFDITRAFFGGFQRATEFTEYGFVRFADHIAEDIKTATMRHSNDDGFNTMIY